METRRDAETGIDTFVAQFGDKYPRAVNKLVRDRETLLTFYDFPGPTLDPPTNGGSDDTRIEKGQTVVKRPSMQAFSCGGRSARINL